MTSWASSTIGFRADLNKCIHTDSKSQGTLLNGSNYLNSCPDYACECVSNYVTAEELVLVLDVAICPRPRIHHQSLDARQQLCYQSHFFVYREFDHPFWRRF